MTEPPGRRPARSPAGPSRRAATSRSRGAVVIALGRPRLARVGRGQRRDRRAVPGRRQGAGRRADGHPRLLAYDIHALGEGTDTIGAVTVRIAPPDIGGERGERRVQRRGARTEHHRGLDRGLHHGAQRAARRGALVGRDRGRRQQQAASAVSAGTAREQRADLDEARRRTTRRPGSSARSATGGRGGGAPSDGVWCGLLRGTSLT